MKKGESICICIMICTLTTVSNTYTNYVYPSYRPSNEKAELDAVVSLLLLKMESKMNEQEERHSNYIDQARSYSARLRNKVQDLTVKLEKADKKVLNDDVITRHVNTLTTQKAAADLENTNLKKQVEELTSKLKVAEKKAADDAAELDRLHGEEKLEAQLKQKEVQMAKLVKDKEKLEAYTKQTLQIFQQKYFGTTQEYKTKLKLKDQLIETLEAKLAKEKRRKEQHDDT